MLDPSNTCDVFTNGSSNSQESGVDIILENEVDLMIEISLCFEFSTTNNQVEYEVVIIDLILAAKMRVNSVRLRIDFQPVASHVKEEAQTKESLL